MPASPALDIYIGFDRQEIVAYHVLVQSILERCSRPVRFTPINLTALKPHFDREMLPQQSTEFSFSRFMTPWLSGYEGWSVFMDCDMLARADFAELFALADDRYAVMVCKHEYVPRDEVKFLNHEQAKYAKKNWSSVMLMNNARCRALTPEFVSTASGLELHQFKWLQSDDEIGALPLEWNWLVGEYDFNPDAKVAHYTRGGPYFAGYEDCDYADEWRAAYGRTLSCESKAKGL